LEIKKRGWAKLGFMFLLNTLLIGCGQASLTPSQAGIVSKDQVNTSIATIKTATAEQKTRLTSTTVFKPSPTNTIRKTPTVYRTKTPSPTKTAKPTPWGSPAKITAKMPKSIPCTAWEKDGCRWNFSVTFQSENGIGVKVERIRRVFYTSKGTAYVIGYGTGWGTYNLSIPPTGTKPFSSWVRTKFNSDKDLRKGSVVITYEGYDDHGNFFTGTVKATLASN